MSDHRHHTHRTRVGPALTNTATGIALVRVTSDAGQYVFNAVTPGAYEVKVSLEGFKTVTIRLDVGVNQTMRADAVLEIGSLTEVVEVTATATAVDVVRAQVSTNVDAKVVTELPNLNRDITTYVELMPGARQAQGTTAGGSQVVDISGNYAQGDGTRRSQSVFYLDGSENMGGWRNQAFQMPNPDTVQEIQIVASSASAEFGKQPGMSMNVITKSGTNVVRGTAFFATHWEKLNANTWTANANNAAKPNDEQRWMGATIGGPVRKNRTFYFASYSRFINYDNGQVRFTGAYSNSGGPIDGPWPRLTTPSGDRQFAYAWADFLLGQTSSFNATGVVDNEFGGLATFFFVQDQWRVAPRVTVTAGLRYELYGTQTSKALLAGHVAGHQSNQYANAPLGLAFEGDTGIPDGMREPDYTNFAPRLGVAWDLFGSGKTIVRAGGALYYAYPPLSIVEQLGTTVGASTITGNNANLTDPWGTANTASTDTTCQFPGCTMPSFDPDPAKRVFVPTTVMRARTEPLLHGCGRRQDHPDARAHRGAGARGRVEHPEPPEPEQPDHESVELELRAHPVEDGRRPRHPAADEAAVLIDRACASSRRRPVHHPDAATGRIASMTVRLHLPPPPRAAAAYGCPIPRDRPGATHDAPTSSLPAPERQGDTLVFPVLPLADYPFVIADRREVGLAVR